MKKATERVIIKTNITDFSINLVSDFKKNNINIDKDIIKV